MQDLSVRLCILFKISNSDGVCRPLHSGFVQSLTDVVEDVLNVLNAYRETDKIGSNACLTQLLFGELTVSVACGMEHAGAGVSHVCDDVNHVE